MKISLMILFFSLNVLASDLVPTKTIQEIAYQAITFDIYFEDEGYERILDRDDFVYVQTPGTRFINVVAQGYSAWDMKEIKVFCELEMSESAFNLSWEEVQEFEGYDVLNFVKSVDCTGEGENWPHF